MATLVRIRSPCFRPIMVRMRARCARAPRAVASIRGPENSAIGARNVGGMTSLFDGLSDLVGPMRSARWRSEHFPECPNFHRNAQPGTRWAWSRPCSPRAPKTKLVCHGLPHTLSREQTAVVICFFKDRIHSDGPTKMEGVARPVSDAQKS